MKNWIAVIPLLLALGIADAKDNPGMDPVAAAMTSASLTPQVMVAQAKLPRGEFAREWQRARDQTMHRLAGELRPAELADARTRVWFRHAQGRVMYPFFHWRETEAAEIERDPALTRIVAELPRIDASLWKLGEVREFVDARVHALARERLASDADLGRDDARWLRAKLRVLDDVIEDRTIWMEVATGIVARHIDDDGARGIDEAIGLWLARRPDDADVARIRAALDADRSQLAGVRSIPYREVSGVTLFLHIREPERPRAQPKPAMLWLHGGSATEGTWWHSPVTAQALHELGVVLVSVELTTGNRFDRDSDQTSDSSAAYQYVLDHAEELGVDPRRVGVAGFSSGASLALLLVTRGAAPADEGSGLAPRFPRPAAAIVSGACADPLSKSEDGYFRKVMSRFGNPADFSPYAQLRAGLPPVLSVHAVHDEFCSHEDMKRFADRSRALGNEVVLVSVEGASHFFGFNHPEGRRLQRTAIEAALARWGW
jgi:acetyl esterase/lipase